MRYFYKGIEVKLVPGQQYNTHWNFFFPTDVGSNVVMSGQPGIDLILVEDKEIIIFEIKSIERQIFAKIHVPFEQIVKWVNAITGLGVDATSRDVKIVKIDRHIDDWVDIHFQGEYDKCLEIFNQYKQEKEEASISHQNQINEEYAHPDEFGDEESFPHNLEHKTRKYSISDKGLKYSEFDLTEEEYESFAIAISEDLAVEDKYKYSYDYDEDSYGEDDGIVSGLQRRYFYEDSEGWHDL